MSNIRNVQWNEGAPAELEAGMLLQNQRGEQILIGDCDVFGSPDRGFRDEEADILMSTTRWAWLIQPHELNWLEDMASRKTRTQE